jgi:recombinational DNA repair ATPase RecF
MASKQQPLILLDSLKYRNVLGLQKIDVQLEQPIVLVCGPNGTGKSSFADGLKILFTGEPVRGAKLKGEIKSLIT